LKKLLLVHADAVVMPQPPIPLGLCLLAEDLRDEFDVRVFDGGGAAGRDLVAAVESIEPEFVGVGVARLDDGDIESDREYATAVRDRVTRPLRACTRAPVILGGSGFTLFPRLLLDLLGADYGIAGEGARSLRALLGALAAGRAPSGIEGLVRRHRGVPIVEARPAGAGSLDLPFSRIDLHVDFSRYLAAPGYPILTKRGRGEGPVYSTDREIEGPVRRLRSPSAVADEIEEAAARLGDVVFEFVDAAFNHPPEHAEAVCREIASRSGRFRLAACDVEPVPLPANLVAAMKDAGFERITCVADSASAKVLRGLRRGAEVEDLRAMADSAREHGLRTDWIFTFGGPGETDDTAVETMEFAMRLAAAGDRVVARIGYRVYPGTKLHVRAVEEGPASFEEPLLHPYFYVSRDVSRAGLRGMLAALENAQMPAAG
jgi:radical SAM superfamily enzyme YgiQ (UPF0313 family)